ncbi:nnp-1 protein putative nuclear protein 1 nop52 [Anaeramoeba flamelloides]|uniref:Nnp-1 protein putative nuclear protein 1 nop52 n=1 Tax=Anaeramoeba flamelloides TaxID=1746091 RepID=A0AAV7YRQ3_9EUKA|nr:nnp-1 protein putative nuclear protein 1 nop52 [Anaeramoeba flamelloides]
MASIEEKQQIRLHVIAWMRKILKKKIPTQPNCSDLIKDCCRVMSIINSSSIEDISNKNDQENLMELFRVCKEFGIPENDLFDINTYLLSKRWYPLTKLMNSVGILCDLIKEFEISYQKTKPIQVFVVTNVNNNNKSTTKKRHKSISSVSNLTSHLSDQQFFNEMAKPEFQKKKKKITMMERNLNFEIKKIQRLFGQGETQFIIKLISSSITNLKSMQIILLLQNSRIIIKRINTNEVLLSRTFVSTGININLDSKDETIIDLQLHEQDEHIDYSTTSMQSTLSIINDCSEILEPDYPLTLEEHSRFRFQTVSKQEREIVMKTIQLYSQYPGHSIEALPINGSIIGYREEIIALSLRCLSKGSARFRVYVIDNQQTFHKALLQLDIEKMTFDSALDQKQTTFYWDDITINTIIHPIQHKYLELLINHLGISNKSLKIRCLSKKRRDLIRGCISTFTSNTTSLLTKNLKNNQQKFQIQIQKQKQKQKQQNNSKEEDDEEEDGRKNEIGKAKGKERINGILYSNDNKILIEPNYNNQKISEEQIQFISQAQRFITATYDEYGDANVVQNIDYFNTFQLISMSNFLIFNNKTENLIKDLNSKIENYLKNGIANFYLNKIIIKNSKNDNNNKLDNDDDDDDNKLNNEIMKKKILIQMNMKQIEVYFVKNQVKELIFKENFSRSQFFFLHPIISTNFVIFEQNGKKHFFESKSEIQRTLLYNTFLIFRKISHDPKSIMNYLNLKINFLLPKNGIPLYYSNYNNKKNNYFNSIFEYNDNDNNNNNDDDDDDKLKKNKNSEDEDQSELISENEQINYQLPLYNSFEEYEGVASIGLFKDHFEIKFKKYLISRYYSPYCNFEFAPNDPLFFRFQIDEKNYIILQFIREKMKENFLNDFNFFKNQFLPNIFGHPAKYYTSILTEEIGKQSNLIVTLNRKYLKIIQSTSSTFTPMSTSISTSVGRYKLLNIPYQLISSIKISNISDKLLKINFAIGSIRLQFSNHVELNEFLGSFENVRTRSLSNAIGFPFINYFGIINYMKKDQKNEIFFFARICLTKFKLIVWQFKNNFLNNNINSNNDHNKNNSNTNKLNTNKFLKIIEINIKNSKTETFKENPKKIIVRLSNGNLLTIIFSTKKFLKSFQKSFKELSQGDLKIILRPMPNFLVDSYHPDSFRIAFLNKNYQKTFLEGIIQLFQKTLSIITLNYDQHLICKLSKISIELCSIDSKFLKLVIPYFKHNNNNKKNINSDGVNNDERVGERSEQGREYEILISFNDPQQKSRFLWQFNKFKLIYNPSITNSNISILNGINYYPKIILSEKNDFLNISLHLLDKSLKYIERHMIFYFSYNSIEIELLNNYPDRCYLIFLNKEKKILIQFDDKDLLIEFLNMFHFLKRINNIKYLTERWLNTYPKESQLSVMNTYKNINIINKRNNVLIYKKINDILISVGRCYLYITKNKVTYKRILIINLKKKNYYLNKIQDLRIFDEKNQFYGIISIQSPQLPHKIFLRCSSVEKRNEILQQAKIWEQYFQKYFLKERGIRKNERSKLLGFSLKNENLSINPNNNISHQGEGNKKTKKKKKFFGFLKKKKKKDKKKNKKNQKESKRNKRNLNSQLLSENKNAQKNIQREKLSFKRKSFSIDPTIHSFPVDWLNQENISIGFGRIEIDQVNFKLILHFDSNNKLIINSINKIKFLINSKNEIKHELIFNKKKYTFLLKSKEDRILMKQIWLKLKRNYKK